MNTKLLALLSDKFFRIAILWGGFICYCWFNLESQQKSLILGHHADRPHSHRSDWDDFSHSLKCAADWTCQQCGKACRQKGEAVEAFANRLFQPKSATWLEATALMSGTRGNLSVLILLSLALLLSTKTLCLAFGRLQPQVLRA
jgi:hypothetical protein